MDIETILFNAEEKMESTINSLENKFTNVRAGRANPNMLDGIQVEYYGVATPLKQLANISIPEARQLMIKPFDKSILGSIFPFSLGNSSSDIFSSSKFNNFTFISLNWVNNASSIIFLHSS